MILALFYSSSFISAVVFFLSLFSEPNWALFYALSAFIISFLVIVFFGIPVVIVLKRLNALKFTNILISSFLIGLLLSLCVFYLGDQSCDSCYVHEKDMLNPRIEHLIGSGIVGLIGMLVGSVFYKILIGKNNEKEDCSN